jgi:hypothetical protein
MRGSLSQITANDEIVKRDLPLVGTCLRDKTSKTRICAAVVSSSKHIVTIFKYICKQMIKCYLTKSMMAKQRQMAYITSSTKHKR